MNDTMHHRGPDDRGEEYYALSDNVYAGMAHRRLAILDLSKRAHQPMRSSDERVTIVYNGEIYDWRQLRKELKDYSFRTGSDTEVVLASYLKWGEGMFEHLHGMFAVAILDRDEKKLILGRDRIGKKPLYYHAGDGEFVFASELKPILKYPYFTPKVRGDILSRFLYQQYITAPDTVLENVYKLEPGTMLVWQDGAYRTERYWELPDVRKSMMKRPVRDYEQAKEGLKERLHSAVAKRLDADVPVGVFLSGGYDSSLMTAYAAGHSVLPVKTYSIGFEDPSYNEAGFARDVAAYLNTQHTELIISEGQMRDLVDKLPMYYDEPFADSSQIPTMLVSALAREDVTVALSGDGGDEFFCGYTIYRHLKEAQLLEPLARAAYTIGGRSVSRHYPNKVRYLVRNRNPATQSQLSSDRYPALATKLALSREQLPCKYEEEEYLNENDWQIRRMILDMITYLPEDILCKVDRASMAYSLEARCPFLDTEVMEYSFRLPHSFKYAHGKGKRILKDLTHEVLPESIMDRPKKGFSVPLDKWLRGPLKEQLLAYADGDLLRGQELFDADEVRKLIRYFLANGDKGASSGENYSGLVWSFFVFQQWYYTYIRKGS